MHGVMGWAQTTLCHQGGVMEPAVGCAGALPAHAKPRGARRGAWCAGRCAEGG